MNGTDWQSLSDEELINFDWREWRQEQERREPRDKHATSSVVGGTGSKQECDEPFTRRLADVQAESVRWLWHPYIPQSKLTLLEGDPGVGKSWLTLAIATAISHGSGLLEMPSTQPGNVLLLTAEDGLGDTIRPRLDALGADAAHVFALDTAIVFDEAGLLQLEVSIIECSPTLVVIDPLVAYLGAGVDLHRANETRPVMASLAAIAERRSCAILAVRHLSKSPQSRSIYRGIGSIDLTAACRSVLLAGCDPDAPGRRALVQIKNNLAGFGKPIGYKIEDGEFFWLAETDLTAEKILSFGSSEEERTALTDAEDFLREILADGAKKAKDIQREARDAGISERTLWRARGTLGVKATRRGESGKRGGGEWYWHLDCQNNFFGSLNQSESPVAELNVESEQFSKADLDCQDLDCQASAGSLNQDEWEEL